MELWGYKVWGDSVLVSICPGPDILAAVQLIGAKFFMTVDLSSRQNFSPFGGDIFRGLQMRGQEKGLVNNLRPVTLL